jgi:membrane protein required for beta-lactamase induction
LVLIAYVLVPLAFWPITLLVHSAICLIFLGIADVERAVSALRGASVRSHGVASLAVGG